MADELKSLFGEPELSFGPTNLYWDTEGGGANLFLGGTDATTLTLGVQKIELVESQAGDRPQDRAITAQTVTIGGGLSRPDLIRLEAVVQGIDVDRDSFAEAKQIHGASHLGERDRTIAKQLTIVKIVDGVESANEFDTIDIFIAAPSSETTELVFDAATQRFYGVLFEAYEDPTKTFNGRALYYSSRLRVP